MDVIIDLEGVSGLLKILLICSLIFLLGFLAGKKYN
tara:strand:+ start:395 stop:502 length:108 start_codon:yes stop_codon:yes gene_type:complete